MIGNIEHTYLLWLLILLPFMLGIYGYALHHKKKVFTQLGDAALVKELTKQHSPLAYLAKFILLFIALAAILLSIANVRLQNASQAEVKNGIDIMIAIDVSKSMLAQDVQPNRLERAKQLLGKLIDKLSNDRIGIVIFAGKAYLQMPLTTDHTAAKMYLTAASTEAIPNQGTVIADALQLCNTSFNTTDKKYKAVVLISDGEDHNAGALAIAEQMGNNGIIINTIGIGSVMGTTITDEATGQPKLNKNGTTIITKLNEAELMQIAKAGNGLYLPYTNSATVAEQLYKALSTLDKRIIKDESTQQYKSLFQYLLGIALVLLMIELLLPETKKLKIKHPKVIMVVCCMLINTQLMAQAHIKAINDGNKAYNKNEYTLATQQYKKAIANKPSDYTAYYNLGHVLFKTNNNELAIQAYDTAANLSLTNAQKSNSQYNAAVILQNDKKIEECIKRYKTALLQDPTNTDARHNLQLALQQKNKQKKEEENNKQNKKKPNKNNNDSKDKQQPNQAKSNITPTQAAQKLEALLQNEKVLQHKQQQAKSAQPNKQVKDW